MEGRFVPSGLTAFPNPARSPRSSSRAGHKAVSRPVAGSAQLARPRPSVTVRAPAGGGRRPAPRQDLPRESSLVASELRVPLLPLPVPNEGSSVFQRKWKESRSLQNPNGLQDLAHLKSAGSRTGMGSSGRIPSALSWSFPRDMHNPVSPGLRRCCGARCHRHHGCNIPQCLC